MNKRPPLLSHSLSDNEQMLLCRRQYTTQKAATKFNELLGDICWPRMKRPQNRMLGSKRPSVLFCSVLLLLVPVLCPPEQFSFNSGENAGKWAWNPPD